MKQNKILSTVLTTLTVFLFFSCAHRESDPDVRSNPFDPGSSSWKENASPIVNVHADSLWYDFNHSKSSGTIRIHVEEDDLNFPYDTLVGSLFCSGSEIKLPRLSSKRTTLLISGIKPGIAAQCTVSLYDSKQSVTSKVLTINVPDSFPAVPPSARIINGTQDVILTWLQIPKANYVVHYSDSLKGPYTGILSVNQTSSNTATVSDQPSGYFPRYYIVATTNKFGTARSTDTLIGRRYYNGITKPYIASISQGSYLTHIAIEIRISSSSNIDHFEIYRSPNDTNAFRLIGTKKSSSSYSYLYYYDSLKTSSNCYYQICAIDNQGRCSFPSSAQYGYLQRLYAPSLTVTPYPEYSRLSWSTISGAAKYRVYRSPLNCIDSLKLLTETNQVSYTDTPPDGKVYYYTVSAVTSTGFEGSKSSCTQGKITILPKPDSIVVTANYYPKHVALAWKKVIGANGYIIHRSQSYNDSTPIDTISGNTYNDTLPDNTFRYYRIAAFNNRGTGVLSSVYSGSVITPAFSNYLSRNDSLFLTFTPNSRAIKYFIYRSSNLTDFSLIDSTTKPSYAAPLKDFKTWYYRFTIQVPEGVSYPSSTASIVRQLSTPYNIKITSLVNGVKMEWSKVVGAERYDIYRSTSSSSNSLYRSTTDTFFIDTLPPGTQFYYYSLRSVNSSATSQVSTKYLGSSLAPPGTPTSVSIVGQLKGIYLTWSMPTGNSIIDGFAIFRSTNNVTFNLIDSTKDYYYYDSVPDTSIYYYKIRSYNTLGYSTLDNTSYSGYLLRPAAPQNLTGTLATSTKYIRITWSPVSSVTKYSIYRATSANGIFENIGSVSNTNIFYDSTCNVNTTYYYKAASISPENRSSSLSSYTMGIRLGPPTITVIDKYDNGVMFWWKTLSYSIQYYNIYRSETVGGQYAKIDSTTGSSYRDSTATIYRYYYKISAVNVVESDLSSAATVSTPSPEMSIIASQGTITIPNIINISWTAVSNALSYRIYKAPTDSFNRNITYIAGGLTSRSYDHYVESDSIYYYKMSVFSSTGESGFSTQTALGYRYPTTKPLPITSANGSGGKDYISLTWRKPPTSVGYNKYNIYRSTSADGSFELIGSTTETSYNDVPPQRYPTVYWYTIKAVNQIGESTPSGVLSGYLTQ